LFPAAEPLLSGKTTPRHRRQAQVAAMQAPVAELNLRQRFNLRHPSIAA
jgi:hypothetical protein